MTSQSKAARIRELLAEGKRPKEICEIVGCDGSYVQVVRQRIRHGSMRPADKRWHASDAARARRRERYHERKKEDLGFVEYRRQIHKDSRQRRKAEASA